MKHMTLVNVTGSSSKHLKALKAKAEVSQIRRNFPQDCNREILPKFPDCCPVEFGIKTAA